ncbi:hypothetical protein [Labrys sp. ZIDIC5]|uniref:hypothetical protein n=1 Tax=Labrys sedimenti TaxID=3106036 RepID=UPI002ACA3AAC|nr:hypothetical protein [Labrys sp. ZIDIC5]MDZ5448962.1 hypothetical protein [Labrys sp. ZIDIC5]
MPEANNIQSPITSRVVTVAGGNLFQVAAEQLGEATRWNDIAALNGLRDPFLTGVVTLKIPSGIRPGNGGILWT